MNEDKLKQLHKDQEYAEFQSQQAKTYSDSWLRIAAKKQKEVNELQFQIDRLKAKDAT